MELKNENLTLGQATPAQMFEHLASRGLSLGCIVANPREKNAAGGIAVTVVAVGMPGYLLQVLPDLVGALISNVPVDMRVEFMLPMVEAALACAAERDNLVERGPLPGPSVN